MSEIKPYVGPYDYQEDDGTKVRLVVLRAEDYEELLKLAYPLREVETSESNPILEGLPIRVLSRDAVEIDSSTCFRAGVVYHTSKGRPYERLGWRYILKLMDEYQDPAPEPEKSDEKIDLSDIPELTDWTGAVRGKFYRPEEWCEKHKRQMVLGFYDRPNSPPGNGWYCPECADEIASHKEPASEANLEKGWLKGVLEQARTEVNARPNWQKSRIKSLEASEAKPFSGTQWEEDKLTKDILLNAWRRDCDLRDRLLALERKVK